MAISLVSCGTYVLAKKVTSLREYLRRWAKLNFGSIKLKKLALLHEIEVLDIVKETRALSMSELRQEQSLLENLVMIRKQEEIY